MESKWLQLLDWLKKMDRQLPSVFPAELPEESSPDFWTEVVRLEMESRAELSTKVNTMIASSQLSDITPLETWFYRRRAEWAAQVALAKAQEGIEPTTRLEEVLEWALVKTWETDGCVALWNHMERDGRAHPENPDGLSPIG